MKQVLAAVFAGTVLAAAAEPVVSDVTLVQRAPNRVSITYVLSEPGYVTLDICTNGVSVGCDKFANATGDFNGYQEAGPHAIAWRARDAWPDVKIGESVMTAKITAYAKGATPDYLVVDLATGGKAFYASLDELKPAFGDDLYKTSMLLMRRVPSAGVEWTMGVPKNDFRSDGTYNLVHTAHRVVLTKDFYLGIYEFTQRQYEILMTGNPHGYATRPSFFANATCYATRPVENVSGRILLSGVAEPAIPWEYYNHGRDGTIGEGSVIDILRKRTGLAFDIPSETQWEFAARGGSCGTFADGTNGSQNRDADAAIEGRIKIDDTASTADCTPEVGGTAPVGNGQPNGFGFYDMVGNVKEMTRDLIIWEKSNYDVADFYPELTVDPLALERPTKNRNGTDVWGNYLVARGGMYTSNYSVTPEYREGNGDKNWNGGPDAANRYTGFRLSIEL